MGSRFWTAGKFSFLRALSGSDGIKSQLKAILRNPAARVKESVQEFGIDAG